MSSDSAVVLWPYSDGGACWDQGLVQELLAGRLSPEDRKYERRRVDARGWSNTRWATDDIDGAVVVVHGGVTVHEDRHDDLRRLLDSIAWAVVIHTSDEQLLYDSGRLRSPRVRTWIQMPAQDERVAHDRAILLGWREGTIETVSDLMESARERDLAWSFAGQVQNAWREACVAAVRGRSDGDLLVTGGFGQGRSLRDHLEVMTRSDVVLCPTGNTVDCQRPWEALEAGALPIADRYGPSWPADGEGYWRRVVGFEPFPCVDDWRELPGLLDGFSRSRESLTLARSRALAWWAEYKRRLGRNLEADIQELRSRS